MSSSQFKKTSVDLRSVPELIEHNATQNPHYPFCVQAKKQPQGTPPAFLTVSHLQLKQAILRSTAWLLRTVKELQLPSKAEDGKVVKGAPVALFVESDVGLLIRKLSLMALGVPVHLPLPFC